MKKMAFLCLFHLFISIAGCGPRITHVVPSAGTFGEAIVISGQGLNKGESNPEWVRFNGTSAVDFWNEGEDVVALVPEGATTGPIQIHRSYVDLSTPSGTADSPSNFTVITDTTSESESNNDMSNADSVDSNRITGTLTEFTDEDWFRVPAGPAGPYGYTLEFYCRAEGLTDGLDMQVRLMDGAGETLEYMYASAVTEDEHRHIAWTAQEPGASVYLEVAITGSTSDWHEVDYTITVARTPINDPNETQDNDKEITESIGLTPDSAYAQSYLGVTNSEGSHIDDYFNFALDEPKVVNIYLYNAGLDSADGARLYLHDDIIDGDYGEHHGTNEAGVLSVNLRAMSWDEDHPFPAGNWYILVNNAFRGVYNHGTGPAPLCFKRPYRIMVTLD